MGKRIINLRERYDMSQAKLSKLIGVSRATMSKYENDFVIPNADIIGKIADTLDTTTDYLVGRTLNSSPLARDEHWVRLTKEEELALGKFYILNPENKARVMERMEVLLEMQKNNH